MRIMSAQELSKLKERENEQGGIRSVIKERSLWCLAMSLITKSVLHARSQDNLKVLYSILES